MMNYLAIAAIVVALPDGSVFAGQKALAPVLSISATETQSEFTQGVSRDLVLQVRRGVDAHGHHFGWDVAVYDRRMKRQSNLLYDCLCGHGPQINDLDAWHFLKDYYPAERTLPVYGYPYEIQVRCIECQVAPGPGAEAHFVRGTIEFSVRRLPASNPQQLRPSDLRKK